MHMCEFSCMFLRECVHVHVQKHMGTFHSTYVCMIGYNGTVYSSIVITWSEKEILGNCFAVDS